MKLRWCSLLCLALLVTVAPVVNATTISTLNGDIRFNDNYGYVFSITDEDPDGDDTTFLAELINTSDFALIDEIFFNMDAVIGTDFTITDVSPDWTFNSTSGPIQFDYEGDSDTPNDRLEPGMSLTFVFDFDDTYFANLTDPFSLWTDTNQSLGVGIGGGEDQGQVAVSFQGIGGGEFDDDSDLLASNWSSTPPAPVPEPATMLLLGSGLLGMGVFGRKRIKS